MKNRAKKVFFLAGIFFAMIFASCSSKARVSSLISSLDEVDRYIAQGYPEDALKLLAKLQKKSVSPMEAVGIYKRYATLGEEKSAEKLLLRTLKKNPENLELNAVYVNYLKKQGDVEQAFSRAQILRGTRYNSLYAELYLRRIAAQGVEHSTDFFLGEEFKPIYLGAYSVTREDAWLENAALIHLSRGEYSDAAELAGEESADANDAFFWACVFYDSERFDEAAMRLLQAQGFLKNESANALGGRKTPRKAYPSQIELSALLSDAYVGMGDDEAAQAVRDNLIANYMLGDSEDASSDLLSAIYLNSALYAQSRDDKKAAYMNLSYVVEKWPDYVPALIAYGNFAYESARQILDDPLTRALREVGISSADMRRFDEMPRVSISDALSRMEESLGRKKDEKLYVAKLELEEKTERNVDVRERLSKIWRVLERNSLGTNLYPPAIMQYAIHTLLSLEQYDEAKSLFEKYIKARFEFNAERTFEENVADFVRKMHLWEVEYCAYFAAAEENADFAKRLYEYAVYERGVSDSGGTGISAECSVQSAANLAMIYSSTGSKDKALELYGRVSGRAMDSYLKSDIMYRIACLYAAKGDKEGARRSLEYGLYLNPGNARAHLMMSSF